MSDRDRQSVKELEDHLEEHIGFLRASADAFDTGLEGEAKRMAVSIRVLVHDTARSKSLLGLLDRKSVPFLNSACAPVDGNQASHSGLVVTLLGVDGGATTYAAFLDDGPYGEAEKPTLEPFDSWWTSVVFIDAKRNPLSRRDLVRAMANQDGGAHVDPKLDPVYRDLSRNNSLGLVYTDDGETYRPMAGPEKAALRQICHEVLKTLVNGYEKRPVYPKGTGAIMGGMVLLVGPAPSDDGPEELPPGHDVGRNAPCPCGSGAKFKRCCGKLG